MCLLGSSAPVLYSISFLLSYTYLLAAYLSDLFSYASYMLLSTFMFSLIVDTFEISYLKSCLSYVCIVFDCLCTDSLNCLCRYVTYPNIGSNDLNLISSEKFSLTIFVVYFIWSYTVAI